MGAGWRQPYRGRRAGVVQQWGAMVGGTVTAERNNKWGWVLIRMGRVNHGLGAGVGVEWRHGRQVGVGRLHLQGKAVTANNDRTKPGKPPLHSILYCCCSPPPVFSPSCALLAQEHSRHLGSREYICNSAISQPLFLLPKPPDLRPARLGWQMGGALPGRKSCIVSNYSSATLAFPSLNHEQRPMACERPVRHRKLTGL
jgi:hypothetical protein